MGQAVDEARHERELTKARLSGTVEQLEARVRAELDWKTRLRRDGTRYAALGAAAAGALVIALVLRAKMRGSDEDEDQGLQVASLGDIALELQALRDELERVRKGKQSQPLWQKVALRGVSAAGTAAGTMAARKVMARFVGDEADAEPYADN